MNEGRNGDKNPNWRGGRSITAAGYVIVRRPGHPMADCRGYVYEHRLVASEKLGRLLLPGEVAHHVNHDKQDNRPENIEVIESNAAHAHHHSNNPDTRKLGETNESILCACGCGATFPKFDRWGRSRRFVTGHNLEH